MPSSSPSPTSSTYRWPSAPSTRASTSWSKSRWALRSRKPGNSQPRPDAASGCVLVGHEKRYDPGVAFARDFIQDKIGELIALKHWYCDSAYRYTLTGTLQPIIETSAAARRPAGDPKADRQRYLVLGHGSHLLDTARYLGGPLAAIRARLSVKAGTYCWFLEVDFENGCLGQLDLTIAVRMDWWEGFQVYGSAGSIVGKLYNPWYLQVRGSPGVLGGRRPVPPADRR